VQECNTEPAEEGVWEAHREYIDIQYIVQSCERIVLQKGQLGKSQNPQRLQNLASTRFSEWQLEQRWVYMNLRAANISDFPLPESGSNCHEMLVGPSHNFAQSVSQNKPCR
jgi:hypothetical protein